jgi:hypothetical protein
MFDDRPLIATNDADLTGAIQPSHLVPPDKVFAQAVRVVGSVWCDG